MKRITKKIEINNEWKLQKNVTWIKKRKFSFDNERESFKSSHFDRKRKRQITNKKERIFGAKVVQSDSFYGDFEKVNKFGSRKRPLFICTKSSTQTG